MVHESQQVKEKSIDQFVDVASTGSEIRLVTLFQGVGPAYTIVSLEYGEGYRNSPYDARILAIHYTLRSASASDAWAIRG